MFDYALSADEVAELATSQNASCTAVYGQLLSWTDVLIGQRHGDVIVVNQSRCLGQQMTSLTLHSLCLLLVDIVRSCFVDSFDTASQKTRSPPAFSDNSNSVPQCQ